MKRVTDVAFGDAKTELKCLIDCGGSFELSTMKSALDSKTFSKWVARLQSCEIEQVFRLIISVFLLKLLKMLYQQLLSSIYVGVIMIYGIFLI